MANKFYSVRVDGAKWGVGFGSALAMTISYVNNHSIACSDSHFEKFYEGSGGEALKARVSSRLFHEGNTR
jgi:hypothetical protein